MTLMVKCVTTDGLGSSQYKKNFLLYRGVVKRLNTADFDSVIRRFESYRLCHVNARLVELVKTPASQAGNKQFKSATEYHYFKNKAYF